MRCLRTLWLALITLLVPALAQAACTHDLPGAGVLHVYPDATGDGVIGGISANQCGVEVTDFCQGSRCLAFFEGLSGYIDVTGLKSGSITSMPAEFVYVLGAIRMTGNGQTPLAGLQTGTELRIVPAADHVGLILPPPFEQTVRMESTGSSGWEGTLPAWRGTPGEVVLYLDQLSAPNARLELFADSDLLQLDAQIMLERAVVAGQTAPQPAACTQTEDLARQVGDSGRQDMIEAYYAAVDRAGITDWAGRTQTQCIDLLRHLDASDIRAGANAAQAPHMDCFALDRLLAPILDGPTSVQKLTALKIMVDLGVTSPRQATTDQCTTIAAHMGFTSLP